MTFSGPVPRMKSIDVGSSCGQDPHPIAEESVVVNENQTLRNVVVYLDGAGPARSEPMKDSVTLDQKHCRYDPHVVAVEVGQTLRVTNSDPAVHNVHWLGSENPGWNFGQQSGGKPVDLKLERPELAIRVKCDVHPWMTAYVAVFDHPWFAVTGESGEFEIKGAPPGEYKLVAWHERLGRRVSDVTISPEKPAEVMFEYKAPE
ncbi:MAG: carboxypeptidase regulatory-like domain-containing protein [Tepidisphaeraceae bacterium]